MSSLWIVERTSNRRFPFRVSIEQGGRPIMAFRTQASWPGPGQQIFCLREREHDPAEPLTPVERVPVANVTRIGRKIAIVLDRPTRKRCEFLTVVKPRKGGGGTVEQIFFRTESGIRAHRSRTRVELRGPEVPLHIVIDSMERYPWRFAGATAERRKLAVGDYALVDGGRVLAVVERKSFDNWLSDVGAVQALHQQLADLSSQEPAALVLEADYRDFLDPGRVKGRWPPTHLARVFAEVAALHPRLPVIFAGNRALANAWTERFFRAVAAARAAPELELALTVGARYDAEPRGPGLEVQLREAVLGELPPVFPTTELSRRFPEVPAARIRRLLERLRVEGQLQRSGTGRGTRWQRLGVTTGEAGTGKGETT